MTSPIGFARPLPPLDREAQAHRDIGHTDVHPLVARAIACIFVALLVTGGVLGSGVWPPIAPGDAAVPGARPPIAAAADGDAAVRSRMPAAADDITWWTRVVAANRRALATLASFETALEERSPLGQGLRPPVQWLLSGWLGAGNEQVYIGRDGWLFYRADVDYVTGAPFLDGEVLARRRAAAPEYERTPQPDPRPAILEFAQALAARGITLVLMPTPVKPGVHPGQLAAGAPVGRPLQNASFARFVRELEAAGVLVFDPAPALARRAAAEGPQYLATDTHWRPDAMQHVALELAAFLRARVPLSAVAAPGYGAEPREARQRGDITAMLDLPEGQSLFPPERVALRFVTDPTGDPWRPSRDADVLLLGDSFTNIYSLASMGWGESAGLAEQLSDALQRPVDRLVQNDAGAYATRERLWRDGEDRLAGKRVVIWQFAARELAAGDWRTFSTH